MPTENATGVGIGTNVDATFSEAMDATTSDLDPSTIDGSTFTLTKPDGPDADSNPDPVSGAVSYDSSTNKATLNPANDLDYSTTYTATVTTGAQDVAGNSLDQDPGTTGNQPKTWTFTTQGPPCTPVSITTHPQDKTITYGENASFTAAASGATSDVVWQTALSNDPTNFASQLTLGRTDTITITKPPVSTSGTKYRAVYGNSCSQVNSNAATLTVNKATPDIAIDWANSTYDGSPNGASASVSGVGSPAEDLGPADLTYYEGTDDTGTPLSGAPSDAGTYTVKAAFDGNDNYKEASKTATITISQADATINVDGYTGVYDGDPHGATGTATGVNDEDLSAGLDLGATFTDVPGGTANWSFEGGTNYNDDSGTANIDISQAEADIQVDGYTGVYDGDPHGATGTATGVKGESLNSLLHLGDSFTNVPGGTANWSFDGNTNYKADTGTANINISQVDATIRVDGYTGVYDGDPHGATGSATGVNDEDLSDELDLGATFTDVPGGTANWSFEGGTNYKDASGTATITITQANATIVVQGFDGTYDGDPHGATTATATGVDGSNLNSLLHVSGSFTNVPGGTGSWSFEGDNNHKEASGTFAVKIAKADATINVNGYTGVYDGNAHGASGTATGVKGESLTSLLDLGATFTNVPGGTANWNFAGNGNYEAANGTAAITITQATPQITWNNPAPVDAGTVLGSTQLNAVVKGVDNNVLAGTSMYTPAAGTVLNAGTQTLKVDFTPSAANAGNYKTATKTVQITVSPYNFGNGFFQPVDNRMLNGVKGGSTVPMKFELFQSLSGTELKSTSAIKTWSTTKVNCSTAAATGEDAIEEYTTGNTSLRFDTTGDQFILNWQAPKATAAAPVGTCYQVNVVANDGSSPNNVLSALFKIK